MKLHYTGIRVRDLKRSIKFYTRTMGLKQIDKGTMKAGGTYVQLKDEETQQNLELNYYPPGTKYYEEYVEGSELDHISFLCKDVRKEYQKLLASRATSAAEPWDEGGWTLAFIRDPDGIWIELIGRKVKAASQEEK